ncbi:MAG: D-cysteine desulfhydrase family protein [Pseudomonadota bacterium]
MMRVTDHLERFPRATLMTAVTPLERLDRLSTNLGIDLWLKRDDLSGLGMEGNKVRQLEFYLGEALSEGADTILITGAVQSNYVRTAAAAAAKLGMQAVLQLEERVPDMGATYHASGNVLLAQILGAEHMHFPVGEDEAGADQALHDRASNLKSQGRKPYVIHLGLGHPPLGALGYVMCADELLQQMSDFDVAVVPSGSGQTHAGFLTGLRLAGNITPVHGICVRRDADQQRARIGTVLRDIAELVDVDPNLAGDGVLVWDRALPPGYGRISDQTRSALELMARMEGIFLDPVYSAKTFAGLLMLLEEGRVKKGQRVVMIHTGGQPALFGYQDELHLCP